MTVLLTTGNSKKNNNYIFASTHTEKVTLHGCHKISGNPCEVARLKCVLMVQTDMK